MSKALVFQLLESTPLSKSSVSNVNLRPAPPYNEKFDDDDVLKNSIIPAEALVMAINQEFKDRDENDGDPVVEQFDSALSLGGGGGGDDVSDSSPAASPSRTAVVKQGSSKSMTRQEKEVKLREAREAAARRKALQQGGASGRRLPDVAPATSSEAL